jgi:hypothetical protein
MMKRWIPVIVMLIVGTLCSTAFQAQDETAENVPGLESRHPVNPKPFDKFRAPVSGTIAFLFSERGKAMLRASPHPLAPFLLKLGGEQSTATGVAPSAGTLPGAPDVLPSYRPRPTGIPQGIMPSSPLTVNSGCGTAFGTRFNREPAAGTLFNPIPLPQNEETIDAVVGGGLTGADLVVEGANDYRGIFGPSVAFGGSLTGYYVHRSGTNCAPQFEGGAPSVPDPFGGSDLLGFGDPVVAIDPSTRGTVFEADVRFNEDATVIAVQRTTKANLINASTTVCPDGTHNTDAAARACWPTGVVLNPLPTLALPDGTQLLYLNDKPHMTVDGRASGTGAGNVYVTATEFDFLTGAEFGLGIPTPSRIWLASCTNALTSCSSPTLISGSDLGTQFSHVSVRPDGIVTVSYADFIPTSSTSFKVDIKFVTCNPASAPATPSCSPPRLVATETNPLSGDSTALSSQDFRVPTYPKHDHRINGANIETFMVWDRCHVNPYTVVVTSPPTYVCPKSEIRMAESVNPTGATSGTWSTPATIDAAAPKDQFFSWIKTERTTNTVSIAYYTAEADYFSHRVAVKLAQILPLGTAPELPAPATILTSQTNDPAADPVLAGTFFGDYIGVVGVAATVNATAVHRAYVGFTYNVSDRSGAYAGPTSHAEQNNHVSRFDY